MNALARAGLVGAALWLAVAPAVRAGEDVVDAEISVAWRPSSLRPLGKWNLGRRHCPGAPPSVARCASDGLPGTFHWPSPEVPIEVFGAHLRAAEGATVAEWVEATEALSSELGAFLRRPELAPILPLMLEQAQAYAADPLLDI